MTHTWHHLIELSAVALVLGFTLWVLVVQPIALIGSMPKIGIRPTIDACKNGETAMAARQYAKAQTEFQTALANADAVWTDMSKVQFSVAANNKALASTPPIALTAAEFVQYKDSFVKLALANNYKFVVSLDFDAVGSDAVVSPVKALTRTKLS